ncbi:MAG TPA: hypothetical protein VF941_22060, partial [Clostridia bacterium]
MLNKLVRSRKKFKKPYIKEKCAEILIKSFSFLNMFSLKSRIMASFLILSIIPLIIVTVTSYMKTMSTIERLSAGNSQQVVKQITENINFATKYYNDQMSQFIIDPKVQDAIWKIINLNDGNSQKSQSVDFVKSSISDFLWTKGTDISAFGICTSGGLSFGVFPRGISPKNFFDKGGTDKSFLEKIVSANGSPVWISPNEWME